MQCTRADLYSRGSICRQKIRMCMCMCARPCVHECAAREKQWERFFGFPQICRFAIIRPLANHCLEATLLSFGVVQLAARARHYDLIALLRNVRNRRDRARIKLGINKSANDRKPQQRTRRSFPFDVSPIYPRYVDEGSRVTQCKRRRNILYVCAHIRRRTLSVNEAACRLMEVALPMLAEQLSWSAVEQSINNGYTGHAAETRRLRKRLRVSLASYKIH